MTGTIITKKGVALISKLLASKQKLIFTRAAVGTGILPSGYDPSGMMGLNQYKMDAEISGYFSEGDEATVIFQIASVNVENGFIITEAGLFAEDIDEGEILYAYLDLSDDPQYVYAKDSVIQKFAEIEFKTVIGKIENMTVVTSPGALVTKEVFDNEIKKKIDADGGDIADTTVSEFAAKTEQFPVPAPGEAPKTLWGKMKKFVEDFKAWCTGVCLIGHIVNNCTSTASNMPLAAAQGKALMDLYTQL